METFSALLALCAGNSPITGEFPAQSPVTRSFDVSLICAWINDWVNNCEAGDLRHHRTHYDVILMIFNDIVWSTKSNFDGFIIVKDLQNKIWKISRRADLLKYERNCDVALFIQYKHVLHLRTLQFVSASMYQTSRGLMEGINMEKSSQGCYKAMQQSQ